MADNLSVTGGSAGPVATDEISGVHHQRVKVQYGVDGAATDVSDTNPLPVDDAGGSLTIDNAALSVTGGGTEAGALRVTVANNSSGVLSVDDNGGSLTVDGPLTDAQLRATAVPVVSSGSGSLPMIGVHVNGATLQASPVTSYVSGDSVGVLVALADVSSLKATRLESLVIQAASVGTGTWAMTVLIFRENPTASTFTDDAAVVIHNSDYMKLAATIPIVDADWQTIGGRKYFQKSNIGVIFPTAANAYAAIIANNTFDGPANDLEFTVGVSQG